MDLHADVLARSKGAADAGEVEAHLFRWQIEARGQLLEIRVQPLRRDEEIDTAVRGGNRKARFRTGGAWSCMPVSYVPSTQTSAGALGSPWTIVRVRTTLPCGCTGGAVGSSACPLSVTGVRAL